MSLWLRHAAAQQAVIDGSLVLDQSHAAEKSKGSTEKPATQNQIFEFVRRTNGWARTVKRISPLLPDPFAGPVPISPEQATWRHIGMDEVQLNYEGRDAKMSCQFSERPPELTWLPRIATKIELYTALPTGGGSASILLKGRARRNALCKPGSEPAFLPTGMRIA